MINNVYSALAHDFVKHLLVFFPYEELLLISANALYQELQPFPELDTFDTIRSFHQELCRNYSPRDHLLKVGSMYF